MLKYIVVRKVNLSNSISIFSEKKKCTNNFQIFFKFTQMLFSSIRVSLFD